MKKKLGGFIGLVILVVFNVITFILTKSASMDKQFWLALILADASILIYILVKFFVKRTEAERGIYPLDISLALAAVVITVLSIIAFVIPRTPAIFTTLIVFYVIIIAIVAILVIFGIFTKDRVRSDESKKQYFNTKEDLIRALNKVKTLIKNESVQGMLVDAIQDLECTELNFDEPSTQVTRIKETVNYIYRDATNENVDNVVFNLKNLNNLLK